MRGSISQNSPLKLNANKFRSERKKSSVCCLLELLVEFRKLQFENTAACLPAGAPSVTSATPHALAKHKGVAITSPNAVIQGVEPWKENGVRPRVSKLILHLQKGCLLPRRWVSSKGGSLRKSGFTDHLKAQISIHSFTETPPICGACANLKNHTLYSVHKRSRG
jgi:hypothetical protein